MSNLGNHTTARDRADRLAAARQWRIDNKPYFDAIYGPEKRRKTPCPTCDGTGRIEQVQA